MFAFDERKLKTMIQLHKRKFKKNKNFGSFSADFQFRAEGKKVTSRAELKILQLELWLEPARLGLITRDYLNLSLGHFRFCNPRLFKSWDYLNPVHSAIGTLHCLNHYFILQTLTLTTSPIRSILQLGTSSILKRYNDPNCTLS